MSNFLDQDSTTAYYDAIMGLSLRLLAGHTGDVNLQRHEDLRAQHREGAKAPLEFLDIAWDEQALNFPATGRSLPSRTPRYLQATEPLYRTAAGR